jgi:hypothetical protein
MTADFDFIVVGSGPSGAMAAQTLVESGAQVAMVDVGVMGKDYESVLPLGDFELIRKTDAHQNRYFLGDDFESIPWGDIKVGAQLTPARKHLVAETARLIPLLSDTFMPMESLAYGGLGSGWGLGCYAYSDAELVKAGLDVEVMRESYQVVSDRIGISAGNDNVREQVTGPLKNLQPPLKMDNSIQKINANYIRRRKKLNRMGITWGSSSMAFLSQDRGDRHATKYEDMDFYTDRDRAAYRSWFTVDSLRPKGNFTYLPGYLALSFSESEGIVSLVTRHIQTGEKQIFRGRKLLLAASALGTARIVMRSQGIGQLPILCNPYTYMPCVNIHMIGKPLDRFKTSMAQAFMIYDPDGRDDDLVSLAFFTYRSLLLYKLVKEAPLNFADGLKLMQYLQSAFVVAGIHHPDTFSEQKYLRLQPDEKSFTGDVLFAHYALSLAEKEKIVKREKVVLAALRQLGCYPIKRMDPGPGSSIHYAGTVPFSADERSGATHSSGRLHGTQNVFIADGSGFNCLPAKGVTFSLMANAHAVALNALDEQQ